MRIGILILSLALVPAAVRGVADDGVAGLRAELERNLKEAQSVRADFVQIRRFKALGAELKVKGDLTVAADGRMAWNVLEPMRYLCILTPEGIKQWDEDSDTVLTLSQRELPWLKALHEGLQSWFKADFRILERDFALSRQDERSLKLVPRSGTIYFDALQEVVLTFAADGRHLERVVTVEKSGDVITLEFQRVQINSNIPDTTWQIPPVLKKP